MATKLKRVSCLFLLFMCTGCFHPATPTPSVPALAPVSLTAAPVPPSGAPAPSSGAPITPENAGQLVELARWGKGPILDVAFSPDGQWLAVASPSGVYLYDAETLAEMRFIAVEDVLTYDANLAFSADGQWLAAATTQGVLLWQASNWTLVHVLPEQSLVIAFSPDSSMLVTGMEEIKLWRVADAKLLRVLSLNVAAPEGYWKTLLNDRFQYLLTEPDKLYRLRDLLNGLIRAATAIIEPEQFRTTAHTLTFSPDGTMLAVHHISFEYLDQRNFLRMWEIPDGKRINEQQTNEISSYELAFVANDGAELAVGFTDGSVVLMQTADLTLSHTFQSAAESQKFARIAFSPETNMLAANLCLHTALDYYCTHSVIRVWNVNTHQLSIVLRNPQADVQRLLFSPDGARLISVGQDQSLILWDVETGERLHVLEAHTNQVDGLTLSPQGNFLVTYLFHLWFNELELWLLSDGARRYTLGFLDFHGAHTLAFSPDDRLLVTGEQDGAIRLRDLESGRALQTWQSSCTGRARVLFSPDNETVVSFCTHQPTVRLWRAADGQLLHELEHPKTVNNVIISPNGALIACYTSGDRNVHLWDFADGNLLHTFHGSGGWNPHMTFSPDNTRLYLHSTTQELLLAFHVDDGRLVYRFPMPSVSQVRLSPDGVLLTVLVNANTSSSVVHLYRAEDGELLRTIAHRIGKMAYSPDGRLLITHQPGVVNFWDANTGKAVSELNYRNYVTDFALTPDGVYLITGSDDGTLRLWGVP